MAHTLSDIRNQWSRVLMDPVFAFRDPVFAFRDPAFDFSAHSDIWSTASFLFGSPPTPSDAVTLFWNLLRLRKSRGSIEVNTEDSSQDPRFQKRVEKIILDSLDWMYENYRVPYEPDSDDSKNLIELATELHVAAARSFRIKQAGEDGLSEEFVSTLNAIERTMKRIKIAVNSIEDQSYSGNPAIATSAEAIWAIVQVELSHVSRSYGNYADAIHYLDQASGSYISALDGCIADPLGDDGTWRHEDNAWVKVLKRANVAAGDESNVWKQLNEQLTPLNMPLAEAASLFTSLKHSPSDDLNWKQIAEDCAGLAYLPQLEWEVFSGVENQETIEDDEGFDISWSEFWRHAEAWATAQLSPSEYRKMRNQDEKEAAERRLRKYFFGSSWSSLPKRAQDALIQADKTWNDKEEGRIEAIFNELRIATEEMCNRYIWQPLENLKSSEWFPEMDKFERHRQEKDDNSHDPNLIGLIWPCEQQFYKKFLAQRKLRSLEIQFLTCDLPKISKKLWYTRRNLAEHKLDKMMQRDAVEEFFKIFLGIGQRGILPELSRIGRKLQSPGK